MTMNILTDLLVWLGYRSKCCGAKTDYNVGYDQMYCTACGNRCDDIT